MSALKKLYLPASIPTAAEWFQKQLDTFEKDPEFIQMCRELEASEFRLALKDAIHNAYTEYDTVLQVLAVLKQFKIDYPEIPL